MADRSASCPAVQRSVCHHARPAWSTRAVAVTATAMRRAVGDPVTRRMAASTPTAARIASGGRRPRTKRGFWYGYQARTAPMAAGHATSVAAADASRPLQAVSAPTGTAAASAPSQYGANGCPRSQAAMGASYSSEPSRVRNADLSGARRSNRATPSSTRNGGAVPARTAPRIGPTIGARTTITVAVASATRTTATLRSATASRRRRTTASPANTIATAP